MMRSRFILLLIAALFAGSSISLLAQSGQPVRHCIACDKGPLTGQIWKSEHGYICRECYKIERRCWICALPATKKYVKMADGRFICRREAKNAVVKEHDVQQMFQRTRNAVKRMTRGYMNLRSPKINVEIFSQPVWDPDGTKSALHRQGLATTRMVGKTFHHNVMLISGLVNTNLIGVSAHEFTHLWINENRGKHKIERHTMEAICEMVAYKLAQTYRHHNYMKEIRENPYTQGRAATLLPLVERYGLKALLRWVIEGEGETPSPKDLARLRSVRSASTAAAPTGKGPSGSPLYSNSPKVMRKKPKELELKGVIGSSGNYTAMISGAMFRVGETRTVKLEGRAVKVKCVKIEKRSVTLEVGDEKEAVELGVR